MFAPNSILSIILLCLINREVAGLAVYPSVTQLTEPVDHAEGPHWDANKRILYYVDIFNGGVLAYHYDSQEVSSVKVGGLVTPVVPARDISNVLYLGIDRNLAAIVWDGKHAIEKKVVLATLNNDYTHARINDGKADKNGRLWLGTMDTDAADNHKCHLYKISGTSGQPKVRTVLSGISEGNGLAWNKANNKFYYIDTPTLKVVEFDYYAENGTLSSTNRTVFDVKAHPHLTGLPDGMTIDLEDNLYVALWAGGVVVKVNTKTGDIMQTIPIPAKHVTSVMFGGPNLDILYVTTSRSNLTPEERLIYPTAGSVFAVQNLGTKGLLANSAHILNSL